MRSDTTLTRQKGFIALYAVFAIAVLVAIAGLISARWGSRLQTLRRRGGVAQARRIGFEVLNRQLAEDHLKVPRMWVPPLRGTMELKDGSLVTWERVPVDAFWRAGAGPWSVEWQNRLILLGASSTAVHDYQTWLEARFANNDPSLGIRGDLVTDPDYLNGMFHTLGLDRRWGQARRQWTTDPDGATGRLNILGTDPDMLSAMSGVSVTRIKEIQAACDQGVSEPSVLESFWGFEERQSLEPIASIHTFAVSRWRVEVKVPTLKETVVTYWRVSIDDGTPGNPWFQVQPISLEAW